MFHVSIVSESQCLLKKLYTWLRRESDYSLHVTTFSANAYERFLETRSELVILDCNCLVPYATILQQLSQAHWDYRVILLLEQPTIVEHDTRTILLYKSALNETVLKALVRQALEAEHKAQDNGTSALFHLGGNETFVLYPDTYFLLYAYPVGGITLDAANTKTAKMKKALHPIGECEILATEKGLICAMRKAKMLINFDPAYAGKIASRAIGGDYTVFFKANVKWSRVEDTCLELERLSVYGYFLKGECVDANDLARKVSPIPFEVLHKSNCAILHSVLSGDAQTLQRNLKEHFMHQLKSHMDFYARDFSRVIMSVFHRFFTALEAADSNVPFDFKKPHNIKPNLMENYPNIEIEYAQVEQLMMEHCVRLAEKKIAAVVLKSTIMLYENFYKYITTESVAQELGIHKIYLGRTFRDNYGTNFMNILMAVRMQHARFLLSHSDLKVSTIGELVGYLDAGYFSRLFRKRVGASPEEYRRQCDQSGRVEDLFESTMEVGRRLIGDARN